MPKMDNLKYKFAKAKYRAGKIIDSKVFAVAGLSSILATSVGEAIVTSNLDEIVSETNKQVISEFKERETSIFSDKLNYEQGNLYLQDLLKSEDLSEKQVYDLIKKIQNKTDTTVSTILGMELGNIGDLRECRAEVGSDDISKIAACTVDKSKDDKSWGITNDLLWLTFFWFFIMMDGKEMAKRWSKKKPRRPLYRH